MIFPCSQQVLLSKKVTRKQYFFVPFEKIGLEARVFVFSRMQKMERQILYSTGGVTKLEEDKVCSAVLKSQTTKDSKGQKIPSVNEWGKSKKSAKNSCDRLSFKLSVTLLSLFELRKFRQGREKSKINASFWNVEQSTQVEML